MNNRNEKIQFLKNLQAGKQTLLDIKPVTFKTFYSISGIITDDSGQTFTEDEINANYSMSKNKCWAEILTIDNYEEKLLHYG